MKHWISRALSGALGAALAGTAVAAAAEAAARAELKASGAYYRYRPYTRKRLDIDQTALPLLGPRSYVEINCDGERGGPPPGKDENAYRALVIGGSAAECFFLDQKQTWSAVAERVLDQPEHRRALGVDRVHIGNIARSILPCHELHQLMTLVSPRYDRLDAIVIMVGASDVVSWLGEKMPATPREDLVPAGAICEQHPDGPWDISLRRTALWQLAVTHRRRVLRPLTVVPSCGDWLHRVRAMRAGASTLIDECADPTPMLDRFEKWLRAIVALAATKAKRVVLVHQPWLGDTGRPELERLLWNFGIGRPYKEEVDVYCTPALAARLMTSIDARAARVAADLAIDALDLMPLLEPSGRTYYDFLHFTPDGAEAVGRHVATALARPRPTVVSPPQADPARSAEGRGRRRELQEDEKAGRVEWRSTRTR